MKANEITLALLKASKVISLENGNVIEYIGDSTYNESSYEKAKKQGEDITLFKTSNKDTKARVWVSVNGKKSTYPYYIDELRKVAESGELLPHKNNFFEVGATATATATNTPRKISEDVAKNKRLCPVSYFQTSANIAFLEAEARHFEDALNIVQSYEKKYGFSRDKGPLGNAISCLSNYTHYLEKLHHIQEVAERYKARVTAYHNELMKKADSAEAMQESWLKDNWKKLTTKEGQRKAKELQDNVDSAKRELHEAISRAYFSDADILTRYGL